MGEVGRNEPCPCGSGKKFKRCCGGIEPIELSPELRKARATHALDNALVDELTRFARKRFGAEWSHGAADEYFDDYERGPLEIQLLVPWSLFHRGSEGTAVAQLYLRDRGARLSAEQRAWLEAQNAS